MNIFSNKFNPDPIWHRNISFVKSALRIVAGGCMIGGSLMLGGVFLVLAEILGVLEEVV